MAALSLKFIDLMKVCEQLEIDLQSPLMERVRHGFKKETIHHTETCKCSLRSLAGVSHSLDETYRRNNNNNDDKEMREDHEIRMHDPRSDLIHHNSKSMEERKVQRKASLAQSVLDLKTAFNQMAFTMASSSETSLPRDQTIVSPVVTVDSLSGKDQSVVSFDVHNNQVSLGSSKGSTETSLSLSHSKIIPSSHALSRIVDLETSHTKDERRGSHEKDEDSWLDCNLCSKCIFTLGSIAIFLFTCSFYFL